MTPGPLPSPGLDQLESALGHRFDRRDRLVEALTHRSLTENGEGRPASYERLEFLGDRVLGLVIAEMLVERYPDEPEGALTRRHAGLVRKETLALVAQEIGLPDLIRLSAGEPASARSNASLLSDVCEAVIAALYLEAGFAAARAFIDRHWSSRMEAAATPPKDPKTALQEWAQGRKLALPVYRLIRTKGPAHLPHFTVQVEIKGEPPAEADGPSKRLAEAAAAAALLDRIRQGSPP